jgi:preprotein translocase subunit SecD
MSRSPCLLAAGLFLGSAVAAWPQGNAPEPRPQLPDGVYAVWRDSVKEKEVLPLQAGEVLLVHRHRFLKKDSDEPPRFVIVPSAPAVKLDLARAPEAVKEGAEVVRIFLKLRPQAATALEQLTREQQGKQVAIVLGGEVVTMHKVRDVIQGGDVQITSCTPGAATYLVEQLKKHQPRP